MSSMIQPDYGMRAYSTPTKARETRQAGTQGSSFHDLAAWASKGANSVLELNSTEFAQQKTELSETEELELFKKAFYADLSEIVGHPTVSNAAVKISDAAFQAMKDDSGYRSQVLFLIQRDLGASFAPRSCSVLITVGTNLDQYRADSWPVGNDSEFRLRSRDSFWEQRVKRHEKFMELQQEAAMRRWLQQYHLSGGAISVAELLLELL